MTREPNQCGTEMSGRDFTCGWVQAQVLKRGTGHHILGELVAGTLFKATC